MVVLVVVVVVSAVVVGASSWCGCVGVVVISVYVDVSYRDVVVVVLVRMLDRATPRPLRSK